MATAPLEKEIGHGNAGLLPWDAFGDPNETAQRYSERRDEQSSPGETLIDFLALTQEAIAKQYADTTNEHVIEDLVDVNYSIDKSAPLLEFSTHTDKRYSSREPGLTHRRRRAHAVPRARGVPAVRRQPA